MSIAAANLFTRNIYKAYLKPDATDAQEAKVSKIASLVMKFGALLFVLTLDRQNAINFQLLGGVWILQTLPAIVFGLFTRWFHRWALLAGWAVGMVVRHDCRVRLLHALQHAAVRQLAVGRSAARPFGLHRADRAGGQHCRRGAADAGAAGS